MYYVMPSVFVGFHVVAGMAFCVTGKNPGLSFSGILTTELALVDMLLDFLYLFTNPFATEDLLVACFWVQIISNIVPALICFVSVMAVTFEGGLVQYPWCTRWKIDDMANIFFAIVTLLFNVLVRPFVAVLMSMLFGILWSMKLLPAFLGQREQTLNFLALIVYNELLLENLPQLIIQGMNNTALEEWTPLAICSFTTSLFFTFKAFFEPTFKICVLRKSVSEAFADYLSDGSGKVMPW